MTLTAQEQPQAGTYNGQMPTMTYPGVQSAAMGAYTPQNANPSNFMPPAQMNTQGVTNNGFPGQVPQSYNYSQVNGTAPQAQYQNNGWESKQQWPTQLPASNAGNIGGEWNQGNDWMQTPAPQSHAKGGIRPPTEMQWNTNHNRDNGWGSDQNWDKNEKDDDEVRVVRGKNGTNVVDCAKTFDEVRTYFPGGLVDILTDGKVASFEKPTNIQAYTWPALMQGEDIIGVAKTGSGKTLAFLLPGFIRVKQMNHDPRRMGPKVLVLAPTRELCQQIYEESEKFGEPAEIFSACAYGGAEKRSQLMKFRQGPHVCIACPGRLLDFLQQGQVNLSNADYFVLDEADRMLDMGFEPQIRSILHYLPNERQSCLFSATWPKEVVSIAQQICFKDSIHIQVGTSDALTSNSDITQHVVIVDTEDEKWPHIQRILSGTRNCVGGVLVFTATKRGCATLARQISSFMRVSAGCIHGDLEQKARDLALRRFKSGEDKILVATDVAQRGLDVPKVAAVINFDTPNSGEDYVHRIGRTGRAGQRGDAHTFIFRSETSRAKDIYKVMQKSGQQVPPELAQIASCPSFSKNSSKGFGRKGGASSKGGFGGYSFGKGSSFGGKGGDSFGGKGRW